MRIQKLNFYKKKKNRVSIILLKLIWDFFGKPLFSSFLPGTYWRKIFLRIFGAKIGKGGKLKNNIKISEPWNLLIGDHCWIGENVWIDNLALVKIGNRVCISQGVYFCTGNHNFNIETFDLDTKEVKVGNNCWIAAKVIIKPGTIIEDQTFIKTGSII